MHRAREQMMIYTHSEYSWTRPSTAEGVSSRALVGIRAYLLLKYSNESTFSLLLVLRADRRERRGRSLVAGALQLGEGRRRRRHQLGGDRLDVARRRRSHYSLL